ncbi:hypothetical protein BaRGS_00002195 [Batillaria attramentaria]|uniref:C1q domain-containing protein n=1 Tax=Batillaria attramentaria TaxID=370345 RepID=A0ABD0M483_9CAEN
MASATCIAHYQYYDYIHICAKVTAASGAVVNYTIFGLMKDGKVIAETETNDDDNADRSSVQVIVQLAAGESLWVQKIGGGGHSISGGGVASTFGGFLLRAGAHG